MTKSPVHTQAVAPEPGPPTLASVLGTAWSCEQAAHTPPATALKVPAPQIVQAVAPAADEEPARHRLHEVEPASSAKEPAAQGMQEPPKAAARPGSHGVQRPDASEAPAGQDEAVGEAVGDSEGAAEGVADGCGDGEASVEAVAVPVDEKAAVDDAPGLAVALTVDEAVAVASTSPVAITLSRRR